MSDGVFLAALTREGNQTQARPSGVKLEPASTSSSRPNRLCRDKVSHVYNISLAIELKRCFPLQMANDGEELSFLKTYPPNLSSITTVLASKYEFVGEIARGKTGVAYKLKSCIDDRFYCLKTISPDLTDHTARTRTAEAINKEVQILKPLDHRCLPCIYEYSNDIKMPFYICTFHPGVTFDKFREQKKRIGLEKSVFAIWSLIDALELLHEKGRTHCDLHAKNILISEEVFQFGILVIDYGSGHRESSTSPETANRGNVHFKSVEQEARFGEPVDRKRDQAELQKSDFIAFGHLLASMRDCFFYESTPAQLKAYYDYCNSLERGLISNWDEAREKFRSVIDPYRAVTNNDRLFLSKFGTQQAIQLPVSKYVSVGQLPLKVINSEVIQKLRGVKQLSFCDWRFPGATHSRFEHSLGVFNLVKRSVDHLIHDESFRAVFDSDDIKGLLLAGLLHDIGHYPYAHVLEQYTAGRFPNNSEAKNCVSHFKHTLFLVEHDEILRGIIERDWGEKALHLCVKILNHQIPILSDLIDGPIDCDKMDYLTRDASHCGVAFGSGLDVEGLLRNFCVAQNSTRLGVRETGVPAVEGFMILQHQMLASVYWHETVRGIISMFHTVLAFLIGDDVEKLKDIVGLLKQCNSDYHALFSVIKAKVKSLPLKSKEHVEKLVDFHVKPNFSQIYVPICVYRPQDKAPKIAHVNAHSIIVPHNGNGHGSSIPINWDAVRELRQAFIASFAEKNIAMDRKQLVVDVPYGKKPHAPVFVKLSVGEEVRITDVSHLKDSIFETPAAFDSPVRVYIDPALKEAAGHSLPSIILSAEEKFHARKVSESAKTDTTPI